MEHADEGSRHPFWTAAISARAVAASGNSEEATVGDPSRLKIVVRTHFFDDAVDWVCTVWESLFPGQVFLLTDDSRHQIDTGKHRKISFSLASSEALGLPLIPPIRTAWYNGDYPMYHMLDFMSDDDYCFLIDYDVYPSVDSQEALRAKFLEMTEYDLVGADFGPRDENSMDFATAQGYYSEIYGIFFPFIGFNKHCGQYLLERRRQQIASRTSPTQRLPFCEAFVGSELRANPSLKVGDLYDLTPTDRRSFGWLRPYLWSDITARSGDGRLYHPVLGRKAFLKRFCKFVRFNRSAEEYRDVLTPFLPAVTAEERRVLDGLAREVWNVDGLERVIGPATEGAGAGAQSSRADRPR